jgi:SAM-dependent methyltransferase
MPGESNQYSQRWFDFFHAGIPEARTNQEIEFVCRSLPLPDFRKILDVCCGMGRHARALSSRGYSVIGIDRDLGAIATALKIGGGPEYLSTDIRNYQPEDSVFDAAIVMGQSFGHFDDTANREVLLRLARGVRSGGRLILDLWNPQFFRVHQGTRELITTRGVVREKKCVRGDRLFVDLDYPDRGGERFEWQLFGADEIEKLAASVGLSLLVCCTNFDETSVPSPAESRIQFVLERRSRQERRAMASAVNAVR